MLNSNPIKFNVSTRKRVLLFICVTILCYIVASVVIGLLSMKGEMTPAKIRISTIVQDLLVFIIPAVSVAVIITRRPADFLMLRARPTILQAILAIITVIVMIPLMNNIIVWNEGLQLPESMADIQRILEEYEENATYFTGMLMGGDSVGSLVIAILIVGLLTGFSEELYFRGALQRLFSTSRVNIHLSIWATAFIFSAVHLQIFGFIPRMLLGALFGYMMYWSGSVWMAMIAHVTNNTLVVLVTRYSDDLPLDFNTLGAGFTAADDWSFWISILATAGCLTGIYLLGRKNLGDLTTPPVD